MEGRKDKGQREGKMKGWRKGRIVGGKGRGKVNGKEERQVKKGRETRKKEEEQEGTNKGEIGYKVENQIFGLKIFCGYKEAKVNGRS